MKVLYMVIFIFKKLDLIKDITFGICVHWDMYERKFSEKWKGALIEWGFTMYFRIYTEYFLDSTNAPFL